MGWIWWTLAGIVGLNVLVFGTMAAVFLIEGRRRKK